MARSPEWRTTIARCVALFTIETTETFAEWVPNLRVERIALAGHFVQTDAADRVNELLLGFLR